MLKNFTVVAAIVTTIAFLIAMVAVAVFFGRDADSGKRAVADERVQVTTRVAPTIDKDGASHDHVVRFVRNSTGSQATIIDLDTGDHIGTATERFARPALSLSKLYIAEYVLENGTSANKRKALKMISDSDDRTASELYAEYPESIDEIAKEYNLISTRGASRWGQSVTSSYDVAYFVATLYSEDQKHPILEAMSKSAPVAADGYDQDYGTAVLPGAEGTKWGWSDDLSLHSSVTLGDGYVAAAAVTGSADDLSEYATAQLAGRAETAGK